jgi:hypothetical protein
MIESAKSQDALICTKRFVQYQITDHLAGISDIGTFENRKDTIAVMNISLLGWNQGPFH